MSQKDAKRLYLAPLEERPGDETSGKKTRVDLGDPWADKDLPRSTHLRQTSAPDPLKRGRTGLPRRRRP